MGVMQTQVLGQLAAELMERIASQYGGDAVIRDVVIVADVEHDDDRLAVHVAGSDARSYVQKALLCEGLDALESVLAPNAEADE